MGEAKEGGYPAGDWYGRKGTKYIGEKEARKALCRTGR